MAQKTIVSTTLCVSVRKGSERVNKYRAQKTNGFDSKREAKRAQELELLQKCGEISDLRYQVPFELIPKIGKSRAAFYVADFVYNENGQMVVEDAKGFKPAVYLLKKKLMLYVHNISIRES